MATGYVYNENYLIHEAAGHPESPDRLRAIMAELQEKGLLTQLTRISANNARPEDLLLVETDSPYLAPHPHRGKRNEPSFIKFIIEKIAGLRKMTYEEMGMILCRNAYNAFRLNMEDMDG